MINDPRSYKCTVTITAEELALPEEERWRRFFKKKLEANNNDLYVDRQSHRRQPPTDSH